MRRFVNQRCEFLGLRLTGQKGDSAAVADAKRGSNSLVEFERDILTIKESNQPFPVGADFAADVVLKFGKLRAFGLRNVLSRDLRPSLYALDVMRKRMYNPVVAKGTWLLCRFTVFREVPKDSAPCFAFAILVAWVLDHAISS
jgi:hypothetical protein